MSAETTAPKRRLESAMGVLLSHATRIRLFQELTKRKGSASGLARVLGLPSPKHASYHLEQLENVEVVEKADGRPVNGSYEQFYCAVARPLVGDEDWADLAPEERERFTRYVLHLIVTDCALSFDEGLFDRRLNRCLIRTPMVVDEEGFAELNELERRGLQDRYEVQARSAARMNERASRGEDREQISVISTTMFFEVAPDPGEPGGE